MSIHWHPDEDVSPSPMEVDMMASVLEGRHGIHAEHVADFLTEMNAQRGDASRSWAWAAVLERIRRRTLERVNAADYPSRRRPLA